MSEEKKTVTKPNYFKVMLYVIIVLTPIVIWFYSIDYVSSQVDIKSSAADRWTIRGQYGDSFGAINALFSGLAFAGIIITILMQREELALQREDLALTRRELEDTRKEFEQQNTTLKRQRFESTFFNMLTIHFKLIDSIYLPLPNNEKGVEALKVFIKDFKDLIPNVNSSVLSDYSTPYQEYFRSRFINEVSHYLQSLISLHRIIKESKFKPKVEERYFDLLRSYISIPERKFLYYHTLLGYNTGLRKMERDLHIVENFPAMLLINPNHHLLLKHLPIILNETL